MPGRLSGVSELFRPTTGEPGPAAEQPTEQVAPSGRVRHDEKITVYVSSAELIALEQARLILRAEHGVAVDRGRIVRAAISLVMAELEARGGESGLVRALSEQ
ncbi:MAG: hypothetical protein VB080_15150 [Propionicimonas sp.]|uniref:hypothetical protein n=1 Tax=Propionicimonas sp. TaxID=1955623 RepID=UPI002B1F6C63|nr:hypothetical protein [Propionicimonas sp.]MEA4945758.1 hypothetical protein [Propionicimonas sp.]MEA5054789.1 hypothetical protein [Propionicimonas sp.]